MTRWSRFRPGVMTRLGLGYEALREHNAALVYCAITGYGCSGVGAPGRTTSTTSPSSGVLDQIGERGRPPAISNWQIADLAGGGAGSAARICAGLGAGEGNGRGSFVDVSMTHEVAELNIIAEHGLALGGSATAGEDWLTGGWPYYGALSSDSGWALSRCRGAGREKAPAVLCIVLDAAPQALGCSEGRRAARAQGAGGSLPQPLAYWTDFFDGIDCCVTPVLTLAEAREHKLFVTSPEKPLSSAAARSQSSPARRPASAEAQPWRSRRGYSVAFAGRRQAEQRRLPPPARTRAGLAVIGDVNNPASVKALFDKTVAAFTPAST